METRVPKLEYTLGESGSINGTNPLLDDDDDGVVILTTANGIYSLTTDRAGMGIYWYSIRIYGIID